MIIAEKVNQISKRSKTRQEIAHEYGIDRKTFYRWMRRANLKVTKGLLCPSEMEAIYNTFGKPFSADNGITQPANQLNAPTCPIIFDVNNHAIVKFTSKYIYVNSS